MCERGFGDWYRGVEICSCVWYVPSETTRRTVCGLTNASDAECICSVITVVSRQSGPHTIDIYRDTSTPDILPTYSLLQRDAFCDEPSLS